jgi:hypothetical protein
MPRTSLHSMIRRTGKVRPEKPISMNEIAVIRAAFRRFEERHGCVKRAKDVKRGA